MYPIKIIEDKVSIIKKLEVKWCIYMYIYIYILCAFYFFSIMYYIQ